MIKYVSHPEIDKERWDRLIAASPQGEAYAFSWYLDIVSPGWDALVSDDYKAVFPLTKRKKFGFSYLFQPYFTQQLGLFSGKPVEEKEIRDFMESIPDKFRLVEIQLNAGNRISQAKGFTLFRRRTYKLDLSPGYSELKSAYSENHRRNLKKTSQSANNITSECSIQDIIALFRINRGKDIENLRDEDYDAFDKLMKAAKEKNAIETVCLKNQDDSLMAGAVFLKSVHSYIFIFSATSEEGKKAGAMTGIIDNFIQRHSGEKTMLDFEGSMDENLARFYKGFGSKEVVYLQVRKNKLPSLIRWLK